MQHHQVFLSVFKAVSMMRIQPLGHMTPESTVSQSAFSFSWKWRGTRGGKAEKFYISYVYTRKFLEPGTTTIHLQNKRKGQH